MAGNVEVVAKYVDQAAAGLEALTKQIRELGNAAKQAGTNGKPLDDALGKIDEKQKKASLSGGSLQGALQKLVKEGFEPLDKISPRVSNAFEDLIGKMSGFRLAAGGIIAVGILVITKLLEMRKAAIDAQRGINDLSSGIQADSMANAQAIARIQATAIGDRRRAAQAQANEEIILAAEVRDKKIRAAEAEWEKVKLTLFGPERGLAQTKMNAEISAANATFADKRFRSEKQLAADLLVINREQTDKVKEYQSAAQASALERLRVEAEVSSDAILEARRGADAKIADVERERAARLRSIERAHTTDQLAAQARAGVEAEAAERIEAIRLQTDQRIDVITNQRFRREQGLADQIAQVHRDAANEIAEIQTKASGDAEAASAARFSREIAQIEAEKQAQLLAANDVTLRWQEAALLREQAETSAGARLRVAELRRAEEQRQILAERAAAEAQLWQAALANAAEILAAQSAAGQAEAARIATVLQGQGQIIAADQVRLEATVAGIAQGLAAFSQAEAQKVRAAVDAATAIAATEGELSTKAIAAHENAVLVYQRSRDVVVAKEQEVAAKIGQAYTDMENRLRSALTSTVDLVQQLSGASNQALASLRFSLAVPEAAALREQIFLLKQQFPELGIEADRSLRQIDEAMKLVASGAAKTLRDAIDQVTKSTRDAANAAVNFGITATNAALTAASAFDKFFFPNATKALTALPLNDPAFAGFLQPPTFAGGGLVPGSPGRPVPIVAHAGEVVIPEPVVRRFASRAPSRAGHYAEGGVVTAGLGSAMTIVVQLNGPTFLTQRQALYELAGEIAKISADRAMRQLDD